MNQKEHQLPDYVRDATEACETRGAYSLDTSSDSIPHVIEAVSAETRSQVIRSCEGQRVRLSMSAMEEKLRNKKHQCIIIHHMDDKDDIPHWAELCSQYPARLTVLVRREDKLYKLHSILGDTPGIRWQEWDNEKTMKMEKHRDEHVVGRVFYTPPSPDVTAIWGTRHRQKNEAQQGQLTPPLSPINDTTTPSPSPPSSALQKRFR